MGGKHASDEEIDLFDKVPWKKILIVFASIVVVAGASYGVYYGVKVWKENNKVEEVAEEPVIEEELMPKTIEGYNVLGQIVIPKIEIEQYILDSVEDKALENGVGKLAGGTINETGNFCVAGHDYEDVFLKLNELEEDDIFYFIDRDGLETEYQIVGIYQIDPDDLTCLLPNLRSAEVTLITCENGATTRLVVKADKVEVEDIEKEEDEI